MTRILVLQGANMNWLGRRQPEIYGTTTADELDGMIRSHARDKGYEVDILYRNSEGDAIDSLYDAEASGVDCVVMNPGGHCYAGYALRDCMRGIKVPVVELHISNHYARGIESVTASAARAVFMGLGIQTYLVALDAALYVAATR